MLRVDLERLDAQTMVVRLRGDLDQDTLAQLNDVVGRCLAYPSTTVLLDGAITESGAVSGSCSPVSMVS